MPIKKKLIHFNSKVDFDKKSKATSISDNTSDIPYTSIVFIKDTKEIWTHGQLYPCQLTDTEISELLNSKVDKETGKSLVSNELITKLTGLKTQTEITTDINNAKTTVGSYTVNGKKILTNPTLSKADVGLGNVDNTSDANKPISTATQTALNQKVDKSSTLLIKRMITTEYNNLAVKDNNTLYIVS